MKKRQLCIVCLPVLLWLIMMGFLRGGTSNPMSLPVENGQVIAVQGTIYKIESKSVGKTICLTNISFISEVSSQIESLSKKFDKNILVYLKESEELHIGNVVQIKGICAYFDVSENPGGFDEQSYYGAQNIAFSVKKAMVLKKDQSVDWVGEGLRQIRNCLECCLDKICEEETASILKAMLLGEKNDLDQETKEVFQRGGIIHILAISGLHISLLGMGIYKVLRKLGLLFLTSGLAAGGFMILFGMMTGFAPSARRAVIMFLIYLGAQVVGRTYDMPNALMLAAVLILFRNPVWITQAGFLLSFGAVAGVLASVIWDYAWMKKSGLSVSVSTWLFTLPLVAWFYYEVPIYGILLNIVVIPFMPVVMLSGIAGIAMGIVQNTLGEFAVAPAHYILTGIQVLCRGMEQIPGANITVGRPSVIQIGMYYLSLLIFYFFFRKKRKIDLLQRAFGIILVITILCHTIPESWTMTFLNVGQGDGICIKMPRGSVWMIDGGSSDHKKLAEYQIEPYLKSHGIWRVACWMVSHFDEDHVSGLLEILEGYELNLAGDNIAGITVECILIPEIPFSLAQEEKELQEKVCALARENGIHVIKASAGDRFVQENTVFEVLAPEKDVYYANRNEASMVVEVTYGTFRALLTGDVEGNGETRLIKMGMLSDVDLLKIAHHGSKNGSSTTFLEITEPEMAVISCGKENSYGHPHNDVLKRLEKIGCNVLRTDEYGAIEVIVKGDRWYIAEAR